MEIIFAICTSAFLLSTPLVRSIIVAWSADECKTSSKSRLGVVNSSEHFLHIDFVQKSGASSGLLEAHKKPPFAFLKFVNVHVSVIVQPASGAIKDSTHIGWVSK
jgi:hypothetical protein